jgi:cytochrome P450
MASCPFNSHNINNTPETLSSGSVHEEQTYILPPGPDISPDSLTHDWFIRPYEFISELASQYGDIFTLRFAHIGTQVIVSRPDHIKAIFNGSPDQLHAGKGNEILRVLMGSHSPMLLDGVQHLARRKTMLPAFHTSHISRLAEVMEQVTSDATSHWLATSYPTDP